jgi:putative flippase GtrA
MRTLSRRDIVSAVITGITTGVIGWAVFAYLGHHLPLGVVFIVPVLWLAGVQVGYALGAVFKPFAQFGKFCAIGFTNAAVDFGVLYLLIGITGLAVGVAYTIFKTISFSVATAHSYFWNKYWSFSAARSRGGGREFLAFIGVSLVSLLINVGLASIVVAFRPAGITPQAWAGISAIVGSAVALIFSFIGFRVFVFRKK